MPITPRRCFISYAHDGMDQDTLGYFLFILRDTLQENVQLVLDQQLKYEETLSSLWRSWTRSML
jgi:hypothetical protein